VNFLLIAMLFASQSQAPPASQPGVMRVIVRDSVTDAPIPGVAVRLTGPTTPIRLIAPGTPPPQQPRSRPAPRTALTDPAGTAVFDNLAPGGYSMEAESDGYRAVTPSSLRLPVAARSASGYLELRADSPDQSYVLYLVESGSLRGRVQTPDGKPIQGATVVAIVSAYLDGRRTFVEGPSSKTGSAGDYVLPSVGPGDYYLRVTRDPLSGEWNYYPGVFDIGSAALVSIHGREDVNALDIQVSDAPRFKISGRVFVKSPNLLQGDKSNRSAVQFAIAPSGTAPADLLAIPAIRNPIVDANGNFVITGIPSGSWNLFAEFPISDGTTAGQRPASVHFASGHVHVNVLDRDVENITIVENSADIAGRVIVDGNGGIGRRSTPLRLSLLPQENVAGGLAGQDRNIEPSPTGEFVFPSVPAGTDNLSFSVPSGLYISDIRLGSKSIYDDAAIDIPLDDPSERMEITLKSGGGTISGMLEDNLPPRPTGQYFEPRIVLVPLALPQRRNLLLYKTTTLIGAPGRFSFRNVPPGEYKVFVWENVPPVDAEKNADFVSAYEPFGAPVTVTDGQTSTVHVQLIPFGR
jgi:hypothetical protein